MFEVVGETANTVGELVDILRDLPADYKIASTSISTFAAAIDDDDECVYLEDADWVNQTVDNFNSNMTYRR